MVTGPMYQYHLEKVGKDGGNGFELDNRRISDVAMTSFLSNENRFTSLQRTSPEHAKLLGRLERAVNGGGAARDLNINREAGRWWSRVSKSA